MRNRHLRRGFAIWEVLVVLVVIVLVLGAWTDRCLGFWVSYAKGHPVDTPYWLAAVASIPFPLTFVADLATEIARLFLAA